jgi:predicted phosphatase
VINVSGSIIKVCAGTKTELKKKVQETMKEARSMGLIGVHSGWDPERVVKTEKGYEITIWVHNEVSSDLITSLLGE